MKKSQSRVKCGLRMNSVPKSLKLAPHEGGIRLFAFSDYHTQDIELLIEEVSKVEPRPDLVLYAGDAISRFCPSRKKNLFEAIASKARYGLCAVAGNDGEPCVRTLISGKDVFNAGSPAIQLDPFVLGGYAILGVDGFSGPFGELGVHSEKEIQEQLILQRRLKKVKGKKLIILTHAPPFGVLDKALRGSPDGKPRSIGSRALRKFVELHKEIILVVCGHVHRRGGEYEQFSNALVVNAANHDDANTQANVAIIDLESNSRRKIKWRQIREASIVPGIGPGTAERLRVAGIRTVEELATAPAQVIRGPKGCRRLRGRSVALVQASAKAIVENRPVLIAPLPLFTGPEVFLDIETDVEHSYVWLVGLTVGREGEYTAFFAESRQEEKQILVELVKFMGRYPNADILSYSGSRFDERIVKKRLSHYRLPTRLFERMLDLHPIISQTIALPTSTYRVKEIGDFFGYRRRGVHHRWSGWDGLEVASRYQTDYQGLKHRGRRQELRAKFLEYNEDDVRCLPFILKAIEALFASSTAVFDAT